MSSPDEVVVEIAPSGRRWSGAASLLRHRTAAAGIGLLVGLVATAVLARWLIRADPNAVDALNRFAGPSLQHPLGTDDLGRDELSRLLQAAPLSLGVAFGAALVSSAIGMTLGLLSGFLGGIADQVIMRAVDGLQALPGFILALAVAGLLGPGLINVAIAVVVVWWPSYARVIRSMALGIREKAFVEAARGMGAGDVRLVGRHVFPHVLGPAAVLTTLEMGHILLAIAGLSFLGLGSRPPTPEWGSMLAGARDYLDRAPMLLIYPGAAITLVVLACNLVGDALRDALDPRLQRHMFG